MRSLKGFYAVMASSTKVEPTPPLTIIKNEKYNRPPDDDFPRIMKIRFKQQPRCELEPDKVARHFTCRSGRWVFVSTEAPEDANEYHLKIEHFFRSPSNTVDWLAHLSEKGWFNPDDFLAMMHRFREATHSYGVL
jgi:hypothetical protein